MCKNMILNTAINAALDLPRVGLWTSAAVAVVFSLDAGLAIVGDTLELKAVGTTQVYADVGDLRNQNSANYVLNAASLNGITIDAWYSATAVGGAFPTGGKLVGGSAETDGRVVYASEVFRVAPTAPATDIIPSAGSSDFQAVCHTLSGKQFNSYNISFNIAGGPVFSTDTGNWIFGVKGGDTASCPDANTIKGAATATAITLTVPSSVSCSLEDGAQICLLYHLTTTSVLQEPGKAVTITTTLKSSSNTVGFGGPVTVVESAKGANLSLVPEPDGDVFISVASGNTEFVSTDGEVASSDTTIDQDTAFRSSTEAIIGYVKFVSGEVVDRTGSTPFSLGLSGSKDSGTLKIEDGQFSASLSSTSKVYLGGVNANAVVENASDKWTATWNLDSSQLATLTTVTLDPVTGNPIPRYTPIIIKADGLTAIDSGTDDEPVGTLDVKLGGTTSISTDPITSALRRIPYDGKVCTAYNIPSPTGAADILTLRITNDSDQTGTIKGTLYNEDGEEIGTALDLLAGHLDYTKSPPLDRATLGLADPLQLQPRETVILTSKNIATIFGETEWPGKRYVLKILSTIPRIEVFNLLRNTETVSLQPLSNVSTSAKGVECSPIP